MEKHELLKAEDQTTFVQVGFEVYYLRLFAFRGLMYYDLKKELSDEYLCCGRRVILNSWLIPPCVSPLGNMKFEATKYAELEYPWYENFGDEFSLMVYANDEI